MKTLKPANDNALVFESCGNIFRDLDIPDWEFQTKLAQRRIRARYNKPKQEA